MSEQKVTCKNLDGSVTKTTVTYENDEFTFENTIVPGPGSVTPNPPVHGDEDELNSIGIGDQVYVIPNIPNHPFNDSWPTTGTTKAFCDAVNADTEAVVGMSYLGDVSFSDLPFVGNGDVLVEIMDGPNDKKTIHLVLASGTDAPYHWEYTYWNDGSDVSGWIGFQPNLDLGLNTNSILPKATNTYDLGSSSYTFKDAYLSSEIKINGNQIGFSGGFYFNGNIRPYASNTYDLGTAGQKWKDLYLQGAVYGTNYNTTLDMLISTTYNVSESSSASEIKWSKLLTFSISANTTFTLETAKGGCLNEYKAIITNSHSTDAIALTFTGVNNIICNDDNCVIAGNTITIPSGTTLEISILNGNMCAINWAI